MIKLWLLPFLGATYLKFVALTSRIVWKNRAIRDELEHTRKGFIYVFWHGRQLFLVCLHRNDQIHPLVSKSEDGELISRVCKKFNLNTIRGSSSRGGVPAILELKETIRQGERVGITPDGPRGPLHEVQSGCLYLAQKLDCPIVPVAYSAKRKLIVGSWDEFMIPFPFNRISMVYGKPIWVKTNEEIPQKAKELQAALNDVTQQADTLVL